MEEIKLHMIKYIAIKNQEIDQYTAEILDLNKEIDKLSIFCFPFSDETKDKITFLKISILNKNKFIFLNKKYIDSITEILNYDVYPS